MCLGFDSVISMLDKKSLQIVTAAAAATAAAAVASAVAAVARRKRRGYSLQAVRNYTKRARAARPKPFDLDVFAAALAHLGIRFESYFRLPRHLFDSVLDDIRPRAPRRGRDLAD